MTRLAVILFGLAVFFVVMLTTLLHLWVRVPVPPVEAGSEWPVCKHEK